MGKTARSISCTISRISLTRLRFALLFGTAPNKTLNTRALGALVKPFWPRVNFDESGYNTLVWLPCVEECQCWCGQLILAERLHKLQYNCSATLGQFFPLPSSSLTVE